MFVQDIKGERERRESMACFGMGSVHPPLSIAHMRYECVIHYVCVPPSWRESLFKEMKAGAIPGEDKGERETRELWIVFEGRKRERKEENEGPSWHQNLHTQSLNELQPIIE